MVNWRKIWVVARHEFSIGVRRASFIIMTALVPACGLLILLVGALFAGPALQALSSIGEQFETGGKPIGVVDASGYFTPILPQYHEHFILYASEAEAEAALREETLSSVLVIPEDYLETGRVTAVGLGSGFGAVAVSDSETVRAFFVDHLLEGRVEPALQARAADPATIEPRTLSSSGERQGEGAWGFVFTFVVPYILSIFLVTSIFVSSGQLLQSVAEEKESRVVEIVVSSIRPVELMGGKVLGLGALGLLQVLVWVASSAAFSGGAVALLAVVGAVTIPPRILILGPLYYLLGYILYAVLMAGVGALGATARESQQLAGVFSLFAGIPYMISGFLFTNPNAVVPRALSFFPLTAPTMMMLRLPLAEVPWIDVVGSIVILMLSIPAALWASAKLFRVGLLIYGKRPTMREIWAILRERG